MTSVGLIKVSNGGIVIPVATVETQASSGGGGISGGAIAGIVVGVIGGLALLGRESTIAAIRLLCLHVVLSPAASTGTAANMKALPILT